MKAKTNKHLQMQIRDGTLFTLSRLCTLPASRLLVGNVLVDMESKIFRVIVYVASFPCSHALAQAPPSSSVKGDDSQLRSGMAGQPGVGGWAQGSLGKLNSAAEETALMAEGEAINHPIRGQGASWCFHGLFLALCVVPEQKALALSRKAKSASPGKAALPSDSAWNWR